VTPRTLDGDPAIQRSASDERDVARGDALSLKREARQLEAWKAVLNGKATASQARWVMWQILHYAGIDKDAFAPDPNLTMFNCGVQNVGRYVSATMVAADEDAFYQMQREARIRLRAEALENEAGRPSRDEDPSDEVFRR
jgi:hypothetical protein